MSDDHTSIPNLLVTGMEAAPPAPPEQGADAGLLAALAPWVATARARVRTGLATIFQRHSQVELGDPARLEGWLYSCIKPGLERMVYPTLALELNVARLQGKLKGATPDARFAAYVESLQQPAVIGQLLEEYPELFRQVTARLQLWGDVSLELIERLCSDWRTLSTTFAAGQSLGHVVDIQSPQRNTKRGGRSVVIFTCSSGRKIVYKPRSLAIESHFQTLLTWLNGCGFQPAFRTFRIVDRDTYGWVEWIEAAPCQTADEVRRFYRRQGAYLALLYALEATDFHLNNIIAAGEHPLLIDLEALFHPRAAAPPAPPLEEALDRILCRSVLRLGLLPEPEVADDDEAGRFDLSGLAGGGGQRTPYTLPTWQDRDADTMRLVRKHRTIRGSNNLPTLGRTAINVVAYRSEIDEGFVALYRLLVERREDLLAAAGPLARFAGDEVRIVPRSGQRYSILLEGSYHPNLLSDTDRRQRYFDRLWNDVEREPHLARLIPYEQAVLLAGDVPLFSTQAGSLAAYTSHGECIPNFFPQSGLEAAQQRIRELDQADLTWQRWLIQASLATVPSASLIAQRTEYTLPTVLPPDLSQRLLQQACAVAERLEHAAVRAGDEASWVGVVMVNDRHWLVEPLGADLYHGLPGVALFLAQLGAVTGSLRWTSLARSAMATLRRYLREECEKSQAGAAPVGVSVGIGGLLYSIAHLAALWRDQTFTREIDLLSDQVAAASLHLMAEEELGLAHGLGGCLAGLLAAQRAVASPRLVRLAHHVGDQLLHCLAAGRESGASAQPVASAQPFAGFLDHPVGAAWTLLALARVTGDSQFRDCAHRLLADPALAARRDPGLLLADVRALHWVDDEEWRTSLQRRVRSGLSAGVGFGYNHSLGCGDLGYLDLWSQAATLLDDRALRTRCALHAAALVTAMEQQGWVTGVPLGVESPGLMAGLAGIGHGLLRLAAPQEVPSVLGLEFPHHDTTYLPRHCAPTL